MTGGEVLVGRQPIYTNDMSVVAYELLFRSLESPDCARHSDGRVMTAHAVYSAVNIGLETLVGEKRIFVNAPDEVLRGSMPILLPPERTVLEILETTEVTPLIVAGCRKLLDEGYALAIDDYGGLGDRDALVDQASVVKVDCRQVIGTEIQKVVDHLHGRGVTVLAEKVEDLRELKICADAGFDLYQGYVFGRPVVVPGKTMTPNQVSRLQLATKLVRVDVSTDEIQAVVRSDPALTYQVLRLAALGPVGGLSRKVRSIAEAIVLTGRRRLQGWVALSLLTNPGMGSIERMNIALARAYCTELVAKQIAPHEAEIAFTAGFLASMEVLLGTQFSELASQIPIDEAVLACVLEHDGIVGKILADVIEFQTEGALSQPQSGIGEWDMAGLYMEALSWATQTTSILDGS